jgi:hypothetical protein
MAKPTKISKPPERRRYTADLGDLTKTLASPALRRHGFAQDALVVRWPEIVGERLAEVSLPMKLSFAPDSRTGGTLTVRIEGPLATQLQHGQDLVLERINQFFGYKAVERLRLVQGPVPPRGRRAQAPVRAGPPPKEVEAMPDGPLKQALLSLSATFPVDKG